MACQESNDERGADSADELALLVEKGIAEPGDHVLLARGDHMNAHGGTNTLKILAVTPAHRRA